MVDQTQRILIVEDEADLQEIMAELMPYFDLAADVASTAQQALELLAKNHYAGAIIDVGLPDMSGLELVKAIRSQPAIRDLPCVAITAWHSAAMSRDALAAGFNAYFPKPFSPETIVEEIKAAIGLK